jgi:hypothetical protein
MPDGRDVVVGLAKAVSSMADNLHFVVHSFQRAVGNAQPSPSENPIQVLADHPSKPDERLQPTVGGPPKPLLQIRPRPSFVEVVPEPLKTFLEVVSPHDRLIGLATDYRQAPLLFVLQIPGVFEPEPSGALESHLGLARESPPRLAPHLVDRMVEMLDNVKPVKHDLGSGKMPPDGIEIDRPHVAANDQDRSRPSFVEPLEELLHGLCLSVLPDPNQASPKEVVDGRQVALSFGTRDLVDADDLQRLPNPMRQSPIDRPLHNGRDSLPVHTVMRGRLFPAQLARQPGDDSRQRLRNALPLVSPGQMLDAWATDWTAHPDRCISQDQGLIAHRQVAPLALHLPRMNPCRPSRAVAAEQSTTRDPFDFCHQAIRLLEDPSNSMAFQTQAFSDTSFQAHRQRPSFRSFGTRTKDSRNVDAPFPFSRLQSHHTFWGRTLK